MCTANSVVACARLGRVERPKTMKKSFKTTTAGVGELARWLADLEVTRVVMESTGVYWKSVYYGLEGLFGEVWLVNAHHVKNVPGRKTDMADAEWLADVAAHGMVRPSLVPEPAARELRELTRYRKVQVVHTCPGGPAPRQAPPRRRHQDLLGRLVGARQVDQGHARSAHHGRTRPRHTGRQGPPQDAPQDPELLRRP